MCGFAGEYLFQPGRADPDVVRAMADRLVHRGPDQRGQWLSPDGRCALASCRLAVIDPDRSSQPMTSDDGRVALAFNGEIYNYCELAHLLKGVGHAFHTEGDTEVALHQYLLQGPDMLDRFTGMFALAVYDTDRQRLVLARDRLGQKPLWYAFTQDRIVFASEAKAILAHPHVAKDMRRISLTYYCTIGYIPSPETAFSDVLKLPPAHVLEISDRPGRPKRYWQPSWVSLPADKAGRVKLVREHLHRSVAQRLVSDAPVGVLLSGGLDSAIVSALAQEHLGEQRLKTFTAGFAQSSYDERPLARSAADRLKTDHTELLIQPSLGGAVDGLLDIFDEPFADSSALPMSLICQAAREHVKVVLTGDGGDEAFGGYDRYRAMHLGETMTPLTYLLVAVTAWILRRFSPNQERGWSTRFVRFAGALPLPPAMQYLRYRALFEPDDLAFLFTDAFVEGFSPEAPSAWFCDLYESVDADREALRAQRHDVATYLPDDLLVKADMMSMAHGLELRSPMLDDRLMQVGLSLPVSDKLSRRLGKRILREAFADVLPARTLRQSKRGFGVPLSDWLRGQLRGELRETLLDPAVGDLDIFRREALEGLVNDHLSGKRDYAHRLWALMVLARWLIRNKG